MKDWRKMLTDVGGYDNSLLGIPAMGVREIIEDIESLRAQLAEKDAEIARIQELHTGLMKNADQMNDELRAEIARLRAVGERFLSTIAALEQDENEETEQAWIDAHEAFKASLAKEPA